jgi:hypothetical protein
MNRVRTNWILFLLLVAMPAALQAQEEGQGAALTLRGYGLYDFHYATGAIGGAALALDWQPSPTFALSLGAEYASTNRISANLQGEAVLAGSAKAGCLALRNRYLWRHYPSLDLQEFTSALELVGHLRHWDLNLGLCNRYTAALVQRSDGGGATVLEPMNVLFALEGWWRDRAAAPAWNVGVRWSSYNDFVIERVANWFCSLRGFYSLSDKVRLTGEVGIHPVGSLNLTASYDGWFGHLGVAARL